MGAGNSGHFYGTKGSISRIDANANRMSKKYPITQKGYFGQPGKNSGIRVICSTTPIETAKHFYKQISKGGHEEQLANGRGKQTIFSDGSRVVFRLYSKSGSPAVEIRIIKSGKIKPQKIHFEEERK